QRGALLWLEEQAQDEKTRERWKQAGAKAHARGDDRFSWIDVSPYRYGDDLIHIKRLGNKFQDLLGHAEFSLFLKDFPEGTARDAARYCRTAEEKRQEALRILQRLWDEQLERYTKE